jgi:hypothetical protein
MRANLLTQNNESLLGRVGLGLLLRVAVVVDNITCVTDEGTDREVCDSPGPSQGTSNLANSGLGLGGLISVGSSEGDAASVVQLHGDRRSSRGLGDSREGAGRNATAGDHLADPGEGRHGSRRGSHCEGSGREKLNWEQSVRSKEEKEKSRIIGDTGLRVSGPGDGVASGWSW